MNAMGWVASISIPIFGILLAGACSDDATTPADGAATGMDGAGGTGKPGTTSAGGAGAGGASAETGGNTSSSTSSAEGGAGGGDDCAEISTVFWGLSEV